MTYHYKNKEDKLKAIIKKMKSAIVAFSGGLDSSYLACITYEVLQNNCIAITALSPSLSKKELMDVKLVIQQIGIPHRFIPTYELNQEEYIKNNFLRCYYCKKELFHTLREIASIENYHYILDGSNCDDLKDERAGRKASKEFQVRSPLIEAGYTKKDIRFYAKKHNLPTWNKPASPCLASRIPYSSPITEEKLRQIEKGEAYLHDLGFTVFRLRHHDLIARIECAPEHFQLILKHAKKIIAKFKSLGFHYITLDLEGYRLSGLHQPKR